MKNIFKLPIIFLLCILVLISTITGVIAATIITTENYVIKVNEDNGYASLAGWNSSGMLNIPNSVKKYYITEISDYTFSGREDISGVDFSGAYTLQRIGMMAFEGCNGITDKLVIPNRVTDIGISAFENCTGVDSVSVYSGTKVIPAQMCYNCTALREVFLSYGIETIGRLAFANCSSLKEVTIPQTVTSIDLLAFYNSPDIVLRCYNNSYAHTFAIDNGYDYVLIDAPEPPTEPETQPETEPETQPETEPETQPKTQSETQTETTQPVEVTYILGDADGDGQITILDATKIQRVLADLDFDEDGMISLRGDVNEDGLNIMDATTVQRHIADFAIAVPVGTSVTRLITH